jgi:hypothetical protein
LLLASVPVLGSGCPRKKEAAPDQRVSPDQRRSPLQPLRVEELSFAGPAGHRAGARFSRGETVTCLFTVTDFTYSKGRAHIVADVKVRGPDGELELHQPSLELLRGDAPTRTPGMIRSAATLNLSPAITPGRHTVELTVRDLLGRRSGTGRGEFTMEGTPAPPSKRFSLVDLRGAADLEVPPGAALPIALTVAGFAARKKGASVQLDLGITAHVEDASGQRLASHDATLVKTKLPFTPRRYPGEYVALVPAGASPGRHRVALTVEDRVGKARSTGLLRFKVVPRRFAIHNLHVHDAAALPRSEFLHGEQVYVRLSVHGLTSKAGLASAAVDLAIGGPDGGVYFGRKGAAEVSGDASKPVVAAGRYPVELPLVLPALCPPGKYRVVIRARDRLARKEIVRDHTIQIKGPAPKPMSRFKVDKLVVQDRPDLPPSKGDTYVAGRSYNLTLHLGGAKLKELRKMTFRARIKGDLRLRRGGATRHESKGLFSFDRGLTYRPLRILVPAKWQVPADLPGGLYDLEVVALDELDDRVSQMVRRVEIVQPSRGVTP